MKREIYETPVLIVKTQNSDDIIVTSGGLDVGTNNETGWGPIC